MNNQTYFHSPYEADANRCSLEHEVLVNCAGIVEGSNGFLTRSIREDFYLMYVQSGDMKISFSSLEQNIHAGDFLILSPKTAYWYQSAEGSFIQYLWVHFTGSCIVDLLNSLQLPCNEIWHIGAVSDITEMFHRLFREFIYHDIFFPASARNLLEYMLCLFSRSLYRKQGKRFLDASVSYIHRNYTCDIKMSTLCKMENMSSSCYRKKFREIMGCAPNEYLIRQRLNQACLLLETTDKTIQEISSLLCFKDPYYFGRIFKRKKGISPGQYRKRFLGRHYV